MSKLKPRYRIKPGWLFIIASLVCVVSGYGQGGFSKLYLEGSGTSCILYDHPYILTAAQTESSTGQAGVLFLKTDLSGTLLKADTFYLDTLHLYPGFQNALIKIASNEYALAAYSIPYSFILKMDTNLQVTDTVRFDQEPSAGISLFQTNNNDLLLSGVTFKEDSVTQQFRKGFWCARYDSQLNLKWSSSFHTPSVNGKTVEQQAHNLMEDSRGNLWLAGYRQGISKPHSTDVLVMRLDSAGNKLHENTYGNANLSEGIGTVLETPDSNFLVVSSLGIELANFAGETGTKGKVRIYKIDSAGSIIWDKVYGPKKLTNYISNAVVSSTGQVWISGYYIDSETDFTVRKALFRSYAFKTNFNGDSLEYREYIAGTYQSDWNRFFDIDATPDGGFVAGGAFLSTTNSPLTGGAGSHVWIVRADSFGCVVSGCQHISLAEEEAAARLQLYPNPTRGIFYLQGLPGQSAALKVYDALGRELLNVTEVREKQAFSLSGQPAGLYLVEILQNGRVIQRTKLMVE